MPKQKTRLVTAPRRLTGALAVGLGLLLSGSSWLSHPESAPMRLVDKSDDTRYGVVDNAEIKSEPWSRRAVGRSRGTDREPLGRARDRLESGAELGLGRGLRDGPAGIRVGRLPLRSAELPWGHDVLQTSAGRSRPIRPGAARSTGGRRQTPPTGPRTWRWIIAVNEEAHRASFGSGACTSRSLGSSFLRQRDTSQARRHNPWARVAPQGRW